MDFESWIVLEKKTLSDLDQALLKDLQEHPEWVNPSDDGIV